MVWCCALGEKEAMGWMEMRTEEKEARCNKESKQKFPTGTKEEMGPHKENASTMTWGHRQMESGDSELGS